MKTTRGGAIQFDARDIALAFGAKLPTKCSNCPHESPAHRVNGGSTFDMGPCTMPDRRTKTGICNCAQFVEAAPLSPEETTAAEAGGLALAETIAGMPVGSSQTPEGQAWLKQQIASTEKAMADDGVMRGATS